MKITENQWQTPIPPPSAPPDPANTPKGFHLKKSDIVFTICAIAVSIFAVMFGIFDGFTLGYCITVLLMILLFFVYLAKGAKLQAIPLLCGLLAFANAAVFICTSNSAVRFFSVILCFLLSLVCFDGMVHGSAKGNRRTLWVVFSAFSSIKNIAATFRALFSGSSGRGKSFGKILLGMVCAIPVLVIIVPLLLSSDLAFSGMMRTLFRDVPETFVKLNLGIVLSILTVTYGFSLKQDRLAKAKSGKFQGMESIYILSFLSAISICYVLYLFSQLAYFFSAFRGFLPDGEITYAQYARKGFFEMCAIAVINLGIVFASLLLARKKNGKVSHGIKALASFIAVFTLIIIATAISKMVLYIGVYGMTVLRLTTSAFMVFLSIVFLSVILRIYCTRINILKTALITAGCIVLLLGTANVNRICAAYNYEAYRSGKLSSIDVQAIYDLGDEGIPYLIKLTDCSDPKVAEKAEFYLARVYLYDYFAHDRVGQSPTLKELKDAQIYTGFARYSIPTAKAYGCLYDYFEKNPEFITKWYLYFQ